MAVFYFETGSTDPCYNLAYEEYLLKNRNEDNILMLWQNANTVVVGLNQNAAEEINSDFVKERNITVVRRTTGGGAVYHDLGNINYSFITSVGDISGVSVAAFSMPVCRALSSMGLRAELSGRNDIIVEGKKVSGVAQRVYKNRILHHGTLLFDSDPTMIAGALKADKAKFESKSTKSVSTRIGNIKDYIKNDMSIDEFWDRIREELSREGSVRADLTAKEKRRVEAEAEEKYRSWEWTYGKSPEYNFKNRARYSGGTLEVRLNVEHGIIKNISFSGDFMAIKDSGEAVTALIGQKLIESDVREALAVTDISAVFGGISLDEVVKTIFNGME